MSFSNVYKISAHAIIQNAKGQILQLKQTYGNLRWGLPGGSPEKGESIDETLKRECIEELGIKIEICDLTGIYYHSEFNSYVFIFKCKAIEENRISLSSEHSEYKYFSLKNSV